jgi:uncharacterized protein YwqG
MREIQSIIKGLSQPAVHLVHTNDPSLSYLGGLPRLPEDASWPVRNGTRMEFLARLSLTELHRAQPISWLPTEGALLFFYDVEEEPWGFDPKDRGGWKVLPVPDLPQPLASVDRKSDEGTTFPRCNVRFNPVEVFPSPFRGPVDRLRLTEEEFDEYCNTRDAIFQGKPKHQVSGFPWPVQGDDMEFECQLVASGLYCGDGSGYEDRRAKLLSADAANWRLLLQLDTDDELGVMWGDAGLIYYWVEEERAKKGDFSNAWLVLQCG